MTLVMSDQEILNELKDMKEDIKQIKKAILNPDHFLTQKEKILLKESYKEEKEDKLVSLNNV
jgi:hypothetical protein